MDGLKDLLEHLGFATPFIYAVAAYGLFVWLDENASDDAKAALAGTMALLKQYDKKHIASALIEVFDRVYTYPLFGFRALGRSSLLTVAIFAAYIFEIRDTLFGPDRILNLLGNEREFYLILLLSLTLNIVSDYCALFVVREWLSRSGAKPVFALLSGTLIGCWVISVISTLRFVLLIFVNIQFDADHHPMELDSTVLKLFDLFAFPVLFVLAWLPLFAVGILVIRALKPLSWFVAQAQWFLKDGNIRPLKAVACVAAILVFAIAATWRIILRA